MKRKASKKISACDGSKALKSILASCGARLAPFDLDQVREITMYDELELDTLGKMALIAIPLRRFFD